MAEAFTKARNLMPLPELTRLCSFHCDDCFFREAALTIFAHLGSIAVILLNSQKLFLGYPRVSKVLRSLVADNGWQWLTCVFRLGIIANLLVSPLDPALLLLPNPSLSCLVVTQDVQIRESVLFPCPDCQKSQGVLLQIQVHDTYIYDNMYYCTVRQKKTTHPWNIPQTLSCCLWIKSFHACVLGYLEYVPNVRVFFEYVCVFLFFTFVYCQSSTKYSLSTSKPSKHHDVIPSFLARVLMALLRNEVNMGGCTLGSACWNRVCSSLLLVEQHGLRVHFTEKKNSNIKYKITRNSKKEPRLMHIFQPVGRSCNRVFPQPLQVFHEQRLRRRITGSRRPCGLENRC